jgi:alkylhydroperoxidase/carboxymuconolactone decarboxylase family protein YurZ
MTDRELDELLVDAIDSSDWEMVYKAHQALRDRLAQPEWVGLTDEEIMEVVGQITSYKGEYMVCVGNAIEAKLKEKNT